MMTSVEVIRTLLAQFHCSLSKEQVHELAEVLVCKSIRKENVF